MAEHDETPVTVNLDRRRPYRANHSDRTAIWVGPGKAEVPAWVAEAWGLGTKQAAPAAAQGSVTQDDPTAKPSLEFLRAAGYDIMNVAEARDYIAGLSETEREIALEYERRNRNRSTLLTEFD